MWYSLFSGGAEEKSGSGGDWGAGSDPCSRGGAGGGPERQQCPQELQEAYNDNILELPRNNLTSTKSITGHCSCCKDGKRRRMIIEIIFRIVMTGLLCFVWVSSNYVRSGKDGDIGGRTGGFMELVEDCGPVARREGYATTWQPQTRANLSPKGGSTDKSWTE
ncbi:hypothetical protein CDAR_29271 [Caerostris darwini]|uniref:Uncharacterized protein n=1 Tax=Caerostris darwini TaxID=1538125 RepID=A0AAV4S294_9ARAC|nr:hypothetical protein CDAR_29271 [Caerostris darwini]